MGRLTINPCVLGMISTNCYLVYENQGERKEGELVSGVIVDPADNGAYILNKCRELSIKPEAVLLTHGHFDHMLAASGIDSFNGAQGRILYVLWQNDAISISSLSAQTSLAKTTLTAMLDRMENMGLIVRKSDPKDRRNKLIALTEKAKFLKNDYMNISQKMNEIYYAGFTEPEIVQFESYLQRILNNLEKEQA